MDFSLDSIELSNFRCFDDGSLNLGPGLTVLIAENGHGKSATLDAIAICLSQVLGGSQSKPRARKTERVDLVPSDATTSYALPPYINAAFPTTLRAQARVDEIAVSWEGALLDPHSDPVWRTVPGLDLGSAKTVARLSDVDLPVFAYYGPNRTRASVVQSTSPALGRVPRTFGYQHALRAGDALAELGPWLAQSEWERSSRGGSMWASALDAVYEAAAQVLGGHGVSRVSYSMEDRDLILDFGRLVDVDGIAVPSDDEPGSSAIPMRLAADGYSSLLGLVADLAFRCGVLNAHLEGEAPQLTSGVVLIDEIDMHLHPSWQTSVLGDLTRAFPRIQFVATTHSPYVLSSVAPESVRRIESLERRSSFQNVHSATEGVRIEVLSEALLGAPTRAPSELKSALESLAAALQRRDFDSARAEADKIEADPAMAQDGEAMRLVRELRWREAESGSA